MGLLTRERRDDPIERLVDSRIDEMVSTLGKLSADVAVLTGEKEGLEREQTLRAEIERLQERAASAFKEKTQKEIELDQVAEKHARETREIEHKVGLHRKQVELDIEVARKSTELEVREANLTAEKERFEKEMLFMRERFETEVGYLREMMGEVLTRLPEVKVERTYHTEERVGSHGDDKTEKAKELTA